MSIEQSKVISKIKIAQVIVCLCFSILVIRLWYLQGIKGSYYRDLSENNRTRTIRNIAARGAVYDRDGKILVRSRPSFNVALMVEDTPNISETIAKIAKITGREEVKLKTAFEAQKRGRPFEPKVVLYDVSRDELAKIKVNTHNLPGVIVTVNPARAYPFSTLASQLFGYAREISKAQLEQYKDAGYRMGDLLGQTGLEKTYEAALRGSSGYTEVEVDARGNRRGELGIVDDQQGNDLFLTLDLDMQYAAEQALGIRRGAVVALDINSGEVLTLASTPTFDANIFSGQMLSDEWEALRKDTQHPLNNRAISSVYPPGSTIKLLWSVAALAEKKITPNTEFFCPGYYVLGKRRYHCHKPSGHGSVNLKQAVTMSCNVYFYQVGQELSIDLMSKYLALFGIGEKTGIDIPGEEPGIRPSEEWKRSKYGEKWYAGDTLSVSIGQGYVVATPLQMAVAMAAIANGGKIYKPFLVKKIKNVLDGTEKIIQSEVSKIISVDSAVFEKVRALALSVVNDPRGTGHRAQIAGINVAGKTGTAQAGARGKESLGEKFRDHAWFVAFAPVEKPTVAVVALVENSGHGGEFAAPVVRQVMEVYFKKKGMITQVEDDTNKHYDLDEETSEGTGEIEQLDNPLESVNLNVEAHNG